MSTSDYHVVGLAFVSLYYKDFDAAADFYTRAFGPAQKIDDPGVMCGWHLGSTWLTLFPGRGGTRPDANPCNVEFAIQVSKPEEVDSLLRVLIEAGATPGWTAEDTVMYEPMRFGYVDDPFGVRIDVYCPLAMDGQP